MVRLASLRVSGIGLPSGEPICLVAAGEHWVLDACAATSVTISGWVLPGLVDAHTHPGPERPSEPLDDDVFRRALEMHARVGVTTVRCPGLAGSPPKWIAEERALPRVFHAGPWLARAGHFIEGWGRRVADSEFPSIAREQAAATGWCKVIADWGMNDEPLGVELLRQIVEAVHGVGGRVAVHSQHPDGGRAAVTAGVDTLEHAMGLDWGLLDEMRAQGTVLVPTLASIGKSAEQARQAPPSPRRNWYLSGAERHAGLVAAAHATGVTIWAGTDFTPHGSLLVEVKALIAAGMSAEAALGAASWVPRTALGLSGLEEGGSADAVVYDHDPRKDVDQLAAPQWIILRGQVLKHP
jgi:imidazolonepropionase-like amidohydrolase